MIFFTKLNVPQNTRIASTGGLFS